MGCEIEGEWPIAKLERLSELLLSNEGNLQARISLGKREKIRYLQGSVSVNLQVTCQRCLQPMSLPLETEFQLALVTSEAQADELPDDYEPLLVEEDKTNLPAILEDELLLAMPLVAMHEHDCSEYLQQQKHRQAVEAEQQQAEKEKQNPFSVLKDLL